MTDDQPQWKLLYSTDTEALYIDETGVYEPELSILDEYETGRGTTRFRVYRFSLERCKMHRSEPDHDGSIEEILIWDHFRPSHPHPASMYRPWFASDLDSVIASCDHASLREDLCSEDPRKRACAYASIGWYHGFNNFDSEPRDLTESAVYDWPDLDRKPEITISTNDDDDGQVTLYCNDSEACRDAQSVLESRWEINDGTLAYAVVDDRADLVTQLIADGWEVDASEWSAPDDQDFRFWAAKYQRSNGAAPEALRTILGWFAIADTATCRRVQDAARSECFDDAETKAYVASCFDAGWVLDAEYWYAARGVEAAANAR